MLVLTRKVGEALVLTGGIRIVVVEIRQGRVRIGVDAPTDVKVMREEGVQPGDFDAETEGEDIDR